MLHIETESGACYEFDDANRRVRRYEGASENAKRADGDWVPLIGYYPQEPIVGSWMVIEMESLSSRGPDDYGNEGGVGMTIRTTTPVVRAWRDEEG